MWQAALDDPSLELLRTVVRETTSGPHGRVAVRGVMGDMVNVCTIVTAMGAEADANAAYALDAASIGALVDALDAAIKADSVYPSYTDRGRAAVVAVLRRLALPLGVDGEALRERLEGLPRYEKPVDSDLEGSSEGSSEQL
jgi:hypothetical protein